MLPATKIRLAWLIVVVLAVVVGVQLFWNPDSGLECKPSIEERLGLEARCGTNP